MAPRVMLVDDQAEVRTMLRTALRVNRVAEVVAEAATSAAATELAAATRPDLVVLDLILPDASGRDVFVAVREASPTSHIVIYSVRESDRSWYERNGARYIPKEGTVHRIVETIESWRST